MSPSLFVVGASVLALILLSTIQFAKEPSVSSCLRLIGSVFFLVVVASHLAEKFQWLEWMGWGLPDSPGHYIDLVSAIAGVILFAGGWLLSWIVAHCISNRERPPRP